MDKNAVSSVISVILMVAVTVILAAVVSVFALDITDSTTTDTPFADFEVEQENETSVDGNGETGEYVTVQIAHAGGDTLDEENIYITVDGETGYGFRQQESPEKLLIEPIWQGSGEIAAGSSVRVISGTNAMDSEDFSTGGRYEFDIYPTNGRGLVPQETSGAGEFEDNTQLQAGEIIRVIWRSDTGGESATLLEYEVR